MKKTIAIFLVLLFAISLTACGDNSNGDDAAFTMQSNDTVGATKHTVVGGDGEPAGTYTVVCVSGHGAITVNYADLIVLANDDYKGEEYGGLTYAESVKVTLDGSDVIMARAFNSSDFEIEFYLDD